MSEYVECLVDGYPWVTNGKVYKILAENSYDIAIINNIDEIKEYPIEIFRKLTKHEEDYLNIIEEKKQQAKLQLNKIYGFKFDKIDDIYKEKKEQYKLGLNSIYGLKLDKVDNKTKPTYYGIGFDVIDFCQMNDLDFMQGNVIKYVTRYKEKNGKEDLLKAKEYIDRMIEEMEGNNE